jgi:DEAD/DEAH box helicase domain-containing protein
MQNKIVLDLETQKAFNDVEGRRPEKLGVSIVVIYDYQDGQYKSFREQDLKSLWPILESADLIIGFNHKHFDNKVLSAYYPGDLSTLPHLDLLEEFYKTAGFRIRLDNLAQANLGEKKSATGLQAIRWYKQGDFGSLEKYCQQDVKVTKDIYEYALKRGLLKYKEINEIKEIELDTSDWHKRTAKAVNYTLPF